MLNITVGTDGACSGNPGVGGYAIVLQCNDQEREITGFTVQKTTNNRMELMAVLVALKWIKEKQKVPCEITFLVDSQYVLEGAAHIRERLKIKDQKVPDWFSGRSNADVWYQIIDNISSKDTIHFKKVTAHSGHPLNERCDKLAKKACLYAKEQYQLLEPSTPAGVPAD